MKILKLEIRGTDEKLGNLLNLLNLIMRNPDTEILSMSKLEEIIPLPPGHSVKFHGNKTADRYRYFNHPKLVWIEGLTPSKRVLDIKASLQKMGLTLKQLNNMTCQIGTAEFFIKASNARRKEKIS